MSNADLKRPVLVVDDEADIRDLMEMTLMKMGLSVYTAQGVAAAKQQLAERRFSLVLTDMRMPDGSGLDVVDFINSEGLDVPVAVITAFGNADQAVQALKNGAFDYLQKPITLAQLRSLVKSAIKINEGEEPVAVAPSPASEPPPTVPAPKPQAAPGKPANAPAASTAAKPVAPAAAKPASASAEIPRLLGTSALMEDVRQMVRKLAKTMVPVYIAGESGSGKEQAARSIHELSVRREQPFVAVNCGAIPENLMESEFFGYKKGSFTGADTDRLGFFQHADGGTLFLDEVADLPLAMQVKLLRAIQEKAVRRIGEATEKTVDVRIICATHKDLAAQVAAGNFRQDLFYRLNVVSLAMPPLREMREDLPRLVGQLLRKHQGTSKLAISKEAQKALLHYNYPGNFRELENILERAVALAQDEVIDVDDLQIHSHQAVMAAEPVEVWGGNETGVAAVADFQLGRTQIQDYLDDIERAILTQALQQTRYNRTQSAKLLGISFRSMRYRMERLSIE
ncbi:sigma-54-dependent transcriptional regulator [Paralysiella testudinis]|uniref:Sigma-54-dependent Fis family transcriptional regulator n=1 Tax=Paralysiella testudinis TaxID=2809020 RepID=A0A892ZLZ0_9NEIS|nr:sigma-54 dependent transcriptional regulator [Paralysiella testudinis]QRQ81899.1 sigma-54-dependent Fis family transcriptional regulator [Paralysiella testudinis]